MSVTAITSVYGMHRAFWPRWWERMQLLDPAPDEIIVAHDGKLPSMPRPAQIVCPSVPWSYPQAFYQQLALTLVKTDWVWFHDVDDIAMLDALEGLGQVDADVWQMGFKRSDGETYVVPDMSNEEYLAGWTNPYVSGSCVRAAAVRGVGGIPDVALQDWALWRRLAAAGARFQSSGRTHFHYMRHPSTRGETELTLDRRPEHLKEMEAALVA